MSKTLVVAGAGVVGLAVARAGARAGLQVLLLERNVLVGMETSARNSEVVHGAAHSSSVSCRLLSSRLTLHAALNSGYLLREGQLEGAVVCARAGAAVRLLRRLWRAVPQVRQAHRGTGAPGSKPSQPHA
jgi:L-2-hydroxyglutarate oxidase LhgO